MKKDGAGGLAAAPEITRLAIAMLLPAPPGIEHSSFCEFASAAEGIPAPKTSLAKNKLASFVMQSGRLSTARAVGVLLGSLHLSSNHGHDWTAGSLRQSYRLATANHRHSNRIFRRDLLSNEGAGYLPVRPKDLSTLGATLGATCYPFHSLGY